MRGETEDEEDSTFLAAVQEAAADDTEVADDNPTSLGAGLDVDHREVVLPGPASPEATSTLTAASEGETGRPALAIAPREGCGCWSWPAAILSP